MQKAAKRELTVAMASNDGYISRDFAKRFEDLDRRKKQSAAIERKKRKEEEAEKAKKGAQAIFKRFTSGDYEDEELHEFTDAESVSYTHLRAPRDA